MAGWGERLADRQVTTIFLGGGTPTVLDAHLLDRIFVQVHHIFDIAADAEITCEANPGTVDRDKFSTLRALGVNRLSMGVQSFQPDELSFLGRIHSVDDVFQAWDAARHAGFDNINLDFIFGLPEQKTEAWRQTLDQALSMQPEHLSLYSLIVEENTPLHHWVESGSVAAPDDDLAALHYEIAMDSLGCLRLSAVRGVKLGSPETACTRPTETRR
jgi:oxygen-independent coproporphyrinogen-3 oxidase